MRRKLKTSIESSTMDFCSTLGPQDQLWEPWEVVQRVQHDLRPDMTLFNPSIMVAAVDTLLTPQLYED